MKVAELSCAEHRRYQTAVDGFSSWFGDVKVRRQFLECPLDASRHHMETTLAELIVSIVFDILLQDYLELSQCSLVKYCLAM